MDRLLKQIRGSLDGQFTQRETTEIARELCRELLNISDTDFILKNTVRTSPQQQELLADALTRIAGGEPLQYVIGHTWFCGHKFLVDSRVLIPRPETTELVEWIEADAQSGRLLDVGTGSGCISISLAAKGWNVTACDVSADALDVARANASLNGVQMDFRLLDILQPQGLEQAAYDAVVSNPPYVMDSEKAEMEACVLDFEPHLALFVPDDDALRFYRAVAVAGQSCLRPGGALYFEVNPLTVHDLAAELEGMGYHDVEIRRDISGRERMLKTIYQ